MQKRYLLILLLSHYFGAHAIVKMPALFSDNMVLQQHSRVAVWGWADPGEKVVITGSWDNKPVAAIADGSGSWKTSLHTAGAGGPWSIDIRGSNTIRISNVWLGEVWLCSGQSNMNFPMARLASWRTGVENYEQEISQADDSLIRMFTVSQAAKAVPQKDVKGTWQLCDPATAGNFSAVAYYFAKELRKATGFAVGIIHSSVGGTAIESWMQREVLRPLSRSVDTLSPFTSNTKSPTVLYNAMIRPLQPYTIRGICWYQGESNSDKALQYRKLFPALIRSWRRDWKSDLPFYFVQIAPQYSKGPEIREAQFFTYKTVPNTGMVVITDAGDSLNIHPRNKKIVGQRLALWALEKDYGKKALVYSGPLYKSSNVENDKIRIHFDCIGSGLVAKGGELQEFSIAGPDSLFVPANARIDGTTILVYSNYVKQPLAVRFAWKNFPRPGLFNKEGLPASPFRTDNW